MKLPTEDLHDHHLRGGTGSLQFLSHFIFFIQQQAHADPMCHPENYLHIIVGLCSVKHHVISIQSY
jgi:hypothetical protein